MIPRKSLKTLTIPSVSGSEGGHPGGGARALSPVPRIDYDRGSSVTRETVKTLAREVGFELAGVAAAEPAPEFEVYPNWVEAGYAGEMDYLKGRRGWLRADPKNLLPSAKSLICVGLVYNTPDPYSTQVELGERGWISRYAWGEDYHGVMRARLRRLAERIEQQHGPFEYKLAVDTAPLLERAYAHHAGLGWIAKNTCLINQQLGSWVFLGELITSLQIEPDPPAPFRCGTCTRCVEACPTDALLPSSDPAGPAYVLDSRRCISYWTIELRGAIPEGSRPGVGQHLFGCDICQDVCPWNRRAETTQAPEFQPRHAAPSLSELAALTEEEFNERFTATAIERSRYRGFLRNVAVAMGNSGQRDFLEPLGRMAHSPDPVIREHAEWAIKRIEKGRE